jgi:cell division protease FtsH
MALGEAEGPIFLAREVSRHKDYSEETAKKVDHEIKLFLDEGLKRAGEILKEHKDRLIKLTNTLVERETMEDWEIRELLDIPDLKNEV